MMLRSAMMVAVLTVWGGLTTLCAQEGFQPHAGMMHSPDVSATHLVFAYASDLWVAPREGGVALPLATPSGSECSPKFSPDGQTIAFFAEYEVGGDLYTLPLVGGVPFRVTHHPAREEQCDWTPDGQLLFCADFIQGLAFTQLYVVPPAGGLPKPIPIPGATHGAMSPDGQWLAYVPEDYWAWRYWKRQQGGRASDIWLFHLTKHTSRKATDWPGTDQYPMWYGRTLYYLSDAGPEHRLNIWAYDIETQRRRQITRLAKYDLNEPSVGPGPKGQGEIVFIYGPDLYLLDLGTEQARPVRVTIPGDRPRLRARSVDVNPYITNWGISPTGERAVIEARGDIWTAPARNGSPRNLTRTSGVAERDPAWSPDGHWIAYFSDATGGYQLYVTRSDGRGETRQLTQGLTTFCSRPLWSPDSRHLAFLDKSAAIYLLDPESGERRLVDRDPWACYPAMSWSRDSRWLAYSRTSEGNRLKRTSIWLYQLETRATRQVTSGMCHDQNPVFDRAGDYLYFTSTRSFEPIFDDLVRRDPWAGVPFVYAGTEVLVAVPLRESLRTPWTPGSDEEAWQKQTKEAAPAASGKEAGSTDRDGDATGKVTIDLEGFERRAHVLSVPAGLFGRLAVNDKDELLYLRQPGPGSKAQPCVQLLSIADEAGKQAEKSVATGADDFRLSADGKKLLVIRAGTASLQEAAAQASGSDVVTEGMVAVIDPRQEWRQIYTDTWRIVRDYLYAANMHGVDWPAVHRQYLGMLEDCASREDVNYVLNEMVGELNVSHLMCWGGDTPDSSRARGTAGLLGVDFEVHAGAYRIARIYEGAPWEADARSPLHPPGSHVKEGDYLLAVNGVPLDVSKDPWAAFLGLGGRPATLTVSARPLRDGTAEDVAVRLLDYHREVALRIRAWIEHNRTAVERKTGGRVGYIYLGDTYDSGQSELVRQFYGQFSKQAFIIDARWNGGGRWPDRFVELLNRPLTHYVAVRDGQDARAPLLGHPGPKCLLVNEQSVSGGDLLAALFRQAGVGPLIGTRTSGKLTGPRDDAPGLIDGGWVSVPGGGIYELDGTWCIEGYGVEPDIEVINDPALMVEGGDPQLDAAITYILGELDKHPYVPPKRPAYPDRSGMGIAPEDR